MRQAEASAAPTARAPAKLLVRQAAAPGPGWTRVPSRPKDCPLGATPRGGQPHSPPVAAGSPLVPSGAWRGNHRRHRLHGDPPSSAPSGHFYTFPSPEPRWDPTSPNQSLAPPPQSPAAPKLRPAHSLHLPRADAAHGSAVPAQPPSSPAPSLQEAFGHGHRLLLAGSAGGKKKNNLLFPPKNTRSQGEDSPPLLTAPSHQPNGLQKRGGGGGGGS